MQQTGVVLFSIGKPKTPCVDQNSRKTKKSKSFEPLRNVLDFGFSDAFGGNQKLKI